jgi:hypothetical protein
VLFFFGLSCLFIACLMFVFLVLLPIGASYIFIVTAEKGGAARAKAGERLQNWPGLLPPSRQTTRMGRMRIVER